MDKGLKDNKVVARSALPNDKDELIIAKTKSRGYVLAWHTPGSDGWNMPHFFKSLGGALESFGLVLARCGADTKE